MKKLILPLIMILPLVSANAREITLDTEVSWNSSVLSKAIVNVVEVYEEKYGSEVKRVGFYVLTLLDDAMQSLKENSYKKSLNEIANVCMDRCVNSFYGETLEENINGWVVDQNCPELCENYVLEVLNVNNKDFYDNSRYFGDITHYSKIRGNSKEVCQKLIEKSDFLEPVLCSGYCNGATNSNLVTIVDYEVSKRYGVKSFCGDGETGYHAYIFNNGTIEDVTDLSEKEALERIRGIQTQSITMK